MTRALIEAVTPCPRCYEMPGDCPCRPAVRPSRPRRHRPRATSLARATPPPNWRRVCDEIRVMAAPVQGPVHTTTRRRS